MYFGNLPYGMTPEDIEQFLGSQVNMDEIDDNALLQLCLKCWLLVLQSISGVTRIITPQNKIGIAYITFDSADVSMPVCA